jgi:ferredoxin-NADP reductase
MLNYTPLRIVKIRSETRDTKSFILEELSDSRLAYQSGQSLTLVFPGKINEERRSYSISSAAELGEPLTITVKRVDNGAYSRHLFDECKEGSLLYTIGAAGFFTLPDLEHNSHKTLVFFAAGSGITPCFPMIKTALANYPAVKIVLIYSNSSLATTIFYEPLVSLQAEHPDRFRVDFLFSESQNLLHARLSKAGVAGHLQSGVIQDLTHTMFYLCGPHSYMQMVTIALLTEGVPAENIRKEVFDTTKPPKKSEPPDKDIHTVNINYKGEVFSFPVQYPRTILEEAKSRGIVLPYSCEAGKCGTCAATCRSGSVWMYYNEVLMDRELSAGRVLTCTGYPITGDVSLEYPQPV